MMKFNNKNASAFPHGSTNSFLTPNKYIPASRSHDEPASCDQQGRGIFYETVLVVTPVLASARLNPDNGSPKRLLTSSDLDEVNDMFSALYLGGGEEEGSTPTINHNALDEVNDMFSTLYLGGEGSTPTINHNAPKTESKVQEDQQCDDHLGRCEQTIYDMKSKSTKVVLRSRRLAAQY